MAGPSCSGAPPSVADWTQLVVLVQKLGDDLEKKKDELTRTKYLLATKDRAPKPNKPSLFSGKLGTIEAWCSHVDAYVSGSEADEACRNACTYRCGEAFNWWQSYNAAASVSDWDTLRTCLILRFKPLNKLQAAQNTLQSWRQLNDVGSFYKTFLSIILDIRDITESEKIDSYGHGLKRAIREPLCIRAYDHLESLMTDTLRIEVAKAETIWSPGRSASHTAALSDSGVAPTDLSTIKVAKLTPEERQRCIREGHCLRCRWKSHLAEDCPEGQRS